MSTEVRSARFAVSAAQMTPETGAEEEEKLASELLVMTYQQYVNTVDSLLRFIKHNWVYPKMDVLQWEHPTNIHDFGIPAVS